MEERDIPQVTGTVRFGDGSPAAGHKVSGMAGGMVGPVYTDSHGCFCLSWSSSTTTLAKLYVDGSERQQNLRDGDDVTVAI